MHPQDTITPEEWRPVVGWEGWYSVSDQGRVRRDMGGARARAGRIRAPSGHARRYLSLGLCRPGKQRSIEVHSLVAAAFLGPRPAGTEVNHRNGHTHDNRASNLEYLTHLANVQHAVALGLSPAGDRNGSRTRPDRVPRGDAHWSRRHPEWTPRGEVISSGRLTTAKVLLIRARHASGAVTLTALAHEYGVGLNTIWHIVHRHTWRHI